MENAIMYKYSKMDLAQFAIFEENVDKSVDEVQYQTEVQFSFDKLNCILCCKVTINMFQTGKQLLKAVLCNFFNIHAQTMETLSHDDKVEFPIPLLIQFASLGYGTMRGVLFARTTDTPLSGYVLPPVYFDRLIDTPFVVEKA